MECSRLARYEVALAINRAVGGGLPRSLPSRGTAARGFAVRCYLMLSGSWGTPGCCRSELLMAFGNRAMGKGLCLEMR